MPVTTRRTLLSATGATVLVAALPAPLRAQGRPSVTMQSWPLNTPQCTGIHDLAPAPDGGVWFTAQASGHLGYFDPKSGRTELIALGSRSSPHDVIQGPDKAAWITDSGQNAIVRVGWPDRAVRVFPLPAGTPYTNLNTAAFDGDGDLWFTGQSGVTGKVVVKPGTVTVKDAPRGRGPYGICATLGRHLVVLAGPFVNSAHRQEERRFGDCRAADQGPGRAPRLERQPQPHLGERMEQRQPVDARPGRQVVAHLESPR